MHLQQRQHTTTGRVVGRLGTIAALVLVAALFGGGIAQTPAAHAAPRTRQTASRAAFGMPHEISKTTLHETSIDGPAFWTNNGAPTAPPLYFLAWTGTDPAHHLNYIAPALGGKVTLSQTSIARPAVVSGGNINSIIAWTGTDSLHHLNLVCVHGCLPSLPKLTLHEVSKAGPALTRGGSLGLLLAWTGTDPNHSLNVLPIGIEGTANEEHWVIGKKVILSQFSSIAGPGLESLDNKLVLSFALPSGRLAFATSSDGAHWTVPSTSPLRELSTATPNMFGAYTAPHDWLSWTGTDSLHHVNVQYTTSFPSWPSAGKKAILHETALGAPAMGCEITSPEAACQFVVAWTGTDPLHHLNMAVIGV